mgnify:CR=1 FL=1
MGMSSYISDEYVKIINMKGLEKYLKENQSNEWTKELVIKKDRLSFMGLDGWKLLSYWYDKCLKCLRDVAVFVEGEVHLTFESVDEAGIIKFENGKCILELGQMTYTDHPVEELRDIGELNDELKKELMLRLM